LKRIERVRKWHRVNRSEEDGMRISQELTLVQILVVVANTKKKNLRTEEEKGFLTTLLG
jgi:hypothetical protein